MLRSCWALSASRYQLTDAIQFIRNSGKIVAVQRGDLRLSDDDLAALKRVTPFQKQTYGGRLRVPKCASRFPGRAVKPLGRCSPFERRIQIDGQNVRVPDHDLLKELCRAITIRETGISWKNVSDILEAELAAIEQRPALEDEPITIERYVRKCGRAQHTADWNFRTFIECHSFNRPPGMISRRWSWVRLCRLLQRERWKLDKWLVDRGLNLNDFASTDREQSREH